MSKPKILVDSDSLFTILDAILPGAPGHYLRELQATMSLSMKMGHPNAINTLIDCYNDWARRGRPDESQAKPTEADSEASNLEDTKTASSETHQLEQPNRSKTTKDPASAVEEEEREPNAIEHLDGHTINLWLSEAEDQDLAKQRLQTALVQIKENGTPLIAIEIAILLRCDLSHPFKIQTITPEGLVRAVSSGLLDLTTKTVKAS